MPKDQYSIDVSFIENVDSADSCTVGDKARILANHFGDKALFVGAHKGEKRFVRMEKLPEIMTPDGLANLALNIYGSVQSGGFAQLRGELANIVLRSVEEEYRSRSSGARMRIERHNQQPVYPIASPPDQKPIQPTLF